jgi:hypothetical protein
MFELRPRGHEATPEETVERGWRGMWVSAGLDERGWGEEVAAVHTVKGGRRVRSKAKYRYCMLVGVGAGHVT